MKCFIISTLHLILSQCWNWGGCDGRNLSSHEVSRNHTKFCCGNLKERNILENLRVHKNIILKWFLKGYDMRVWYRFYFHKTRPVATLNTVMTFRFPKDGLSLEKLNNSCLLGEKLFKSISLFYCRIKCSTSGPTRSHTYTHIIKHTYIYWRDFRA
jgi:hypothetical protein